MNQVCSCEVREMTDIKDKIKEAVEDEIEDVKVEPEIDDDSIGIDISTEHVKADIDVDQNGVVDVTVNNHKFSVNIKGIDKVLAFFYLPNGKVNKDRCVATGTSVMFILSYLGLI